MWKQGKRVQGATCSSETERVGGRKTSIKATDKHFKILGRFSQQRMGEKIRNPERIYGPDLDGQKGGQGPG